MNILLIGSGGREHSLAICLAKSPKVKLFSSPGNPGIAQVSEIVSLDLNEHNQVVEFCQKNLIDLVVVGPEKPLSDGLADSLRNNSINVFGPSQLGALLESSKDYAKQFMKKYDIPTAAFRTFNKDELSLAKQYVKNHSMPVVIKADGLAAGKGVIIADHIDEALTALDTIFSGEFGEAGDRIVVEEFLLGEEASVFAVCDGKDYVLLAPSQDHKRIGDGDAGKNTGGMGAYAPTWLVNDSIMEKVRRKIIDKVLFGLQKEGIDYIGCLYVGLMIYNGEPNVVEFNCRFGDPETQPVLTIFEGDFAGLLYSAALGKIDKSKMIRASNGFATCVVLASDGYPDNYETNKKITGLNALPPGVVAYHAGTKSIDGELFTAGGRVLGITAVGNSLAESIFNAYSAISAVDFDNIYYRKDIGLKGMKY